MKPAKLQARQKASKAPAWPVAGVCVFLVLAVLAVFGQTAKFGFVNYDDSHNVYDNPVVEKGLSLDAVGWAFTHDQVNNWIPLTTLSHMLDCQVFGLHAGGHHLVNVLWHAATAVLLFLVLRQMTGSLWRSAFVAAVFAVHPLRAESVAWVSERKDVLSGFFFMLAIGVYVRQVRQPSRAGYVMLMLLFALGLLAKSMVVTLPFVLLLLDYWPLGRFHNWPQFLRLVAEKIPLFVLAAISCVATVLVPGLVVPGGDRFPLMERLDNALVSYVVYLWQMVFPAGLATPYPSPPNGPPVLKVCLAFVLLAAISAGVMMWRKKRPGLLVGWLWYLGMLFPVIGIVQISIGTSHADRYTYLPEIGSAMAVTWAVAEGSAGWKHRRLILGSLMTAVVGTLTVCGYIQTSYWQDNEALWTRALTTTSRNYVAHNNLGNDLSTRGDKDGAIRQYLEALEIKPDYPKALNNLGIAYSAKGDREEAIVQYRKSLEINPDYAEARYNLGNALFGKGDREEAILQFRKALEINPDYPKALNNLGIALSARGDREEAIMQFRKALEIKPDYADARNNLANTLVMKGEFEAAIAQFQKVLEIQPDQIKALDNLAWLLATTPDASLRNGAKAVALATRANQLTRDGNPEILRTVGAALAEDGNYSLATTAARRALALAEAQKNSALAVKLSNDIQLYQANTPLRNAPQ